MHGGGLREELRGCPLPPRARSDTRRRMGSGSPPGERGPTERGVWGPGVGSSTRGRTSFFLLFRQLDEPRQSSGHRSLRQRWIGLRGELAKRERGYRSRSSAAPWRLGARLGSAPAADSDRAACSCARADRLCLTRFAWSAFASRFASARSPATSARSSSESTVSAAPRPKGRPRSRPSSSHTPPSGTHGRLRACARRRPTRRCG